MKMFLNSREEIKHKGDEKGSENNMQNEKGCDAKMSRVSSNY